MAYGARLESVLGASPRGFESPILRQILPASSTRWVQAQRPLSGFESPILRRVMSREICHEELGHRPGSFMLLRQQLRLGHSVALPHMLLLWCQT